MEIHDMPNTIKRARAAVAEAIRLTQQVQEGETEITAKLTDTANNLARWEGEKRTALAKEIRAQGCKPQTGFIYDYCATCGQVWPDAKATCPNHSET